MARRNPSPTTGDTDKSTALERDTATPRYGPTEAIARCPSCARACLWSDRHRLTHRPDCPEANR